MDVPSGLACGCICPKCKSRLVARKGPVRIHHFAHHDSKECEGAMETALHLMAKQILEEEKRLQLPECTVKVSLVDGNGRTHSLERCIEPPTLACLDMVRIEAWSGNIRPDILGMWNGAPLLVEIAVRHFCDRKKKESIRRRGSAAIEVDLSKCDYSLTKAELREILVSSLKHKKWIAHPAYAEARKRLAAELNEKVKRVKVPTRKVYRPVAYRSMPQAECQQPINPSSRGQGIWFHCEACRHLFKDKSSAGSLVCPQCRALVSRAPPLRGRG